MAAVPIATMKIRNLWSSVLQTLKINSNGTNSNGTNAEVKKLISTRNKPVFAENKSVNLGPKRSINPLLRAILGPTTPLKMVRWFIPQEEDNIKTFAISNFNDNKNNNNRTKRAIHLAPLIPIVGRMFEWG